MSSKGNGYIFRVDRYNTIVEVDSTDALFNETFSNVRDRKGRLIHRGVVLPPDLHTTQESESDLPSQDGIIAHPSVTPAISISNRYQALQYSNDESPDDESPEEENPNTSQNNPKATADTLKDTPNRPTTTKESSDILPSHKHWHYVPANAQTGKGDRRNDGPKSVSFFQAPPTVQGEYRRNARNIPLQASAPANVMSALMQTPEEYNPELDILMSCLESKIPADLCLLSTQRTSALHENFSGNIDGHDPKSQKEIDLLPPEEAKRYNDTTLAEFNGMKKKQVMELTPQYLLPKNTKIYPSVVNWTTKRVSGVYSKTKCRTICFGGHRYDKTYADCFAPTVNFTSVLMTLALELCSVGPSAALIIHKPTLTPISTNSVLCMRVPEFLREYDHNGDELFWRLKKVIYGHPKGSRL
jgi:hypothetical protein